MHTEASLAGLQYTLYTPDTQPVTATLLLLHGMAEHHQRYAAFAQYLTTHGVAVLAYDQLGHGRTAPTNAERGFFQLDHPVERLIQDAQHMAAMLARLFPAVPHFVLGHSMGSFVVRCLLQQAGSCFQGAILMGTAAAVPGASLMRALLSVLNQLVPRHRSKLLNALFGWVNNRAFKEPAPNDSLKWLSANQQNQVAYLQDPLCGIPFTNNGFYTLLYLMKQATEGPWTSGIPAALPVLLVSGEDDPVGQFGQGIRRVAQQLRQAGFTQVQQVLYPGLRHEILQEASKQQVYDDVATWLSARVVQVPPKH
ncbi:alpha/beta fold hydrolase [Hymenobacter sp. BT507]|uniref:Alpha/beta fold hydrolase n=1 Tax=Hymenobacter citatus TaxID=2763506 RepID=A0ABR7MR19_9BACT|nr:alpha/beta fold hydrolase [Hymenobacter citatus]MBC6613180.1 alpha/beta fold hydrolase [Hymenobacter citatus]